MFLRKRLSSLSAKSKKIISGVLVAAMVAGSVIAGTSLKAGAYSKTQDVLDELLGAAKPYGVVADEFKNANHNQTCFATNNLVITDQWLSAWLDMSVGTTYIRSFDNTGSAEVFIDRNAFNNLVLGTDYDYVPTENKCYIKGADGKRTGAVINVNNCKDTINVYYAEDYMDVTAALDKVYDNFKEYADISDEEADIVIKANDEKKIDLSSFKDKQIVVVNMYASNYKDWQGNQKRKQKRGFRTKGEAKEWERDFLQQQSQGVDIEFGNFLEIYYKDMDVRLREHTMYTKRYIIDLKIRPYFEKKILSEITVADVRAWQNELLIYKDKNGKGYSQTYLKTINCQLTAIFNYAIRYYNLQDNLCRKAGAIGKSKGEPKDFWMQEEFNDFLETVSDKPETRKAFLLLYWTGMRIGELLALTYNDINLEEKTISINKSYQRLKGKDMITQPKTPKSIRVITMPDFLAEEFREYCSHLYGIMKKERLFRFTKSHMEHCMATGIERSGVKRIRLHDLRHSHARNRRVFLPTGIKRWTESEKYGKISIRNDIVKSEVLKEKYYGIIW